MLYKTHDENKMDQQSKDVQENPNIISSKRVSNVVSNRPPNSGESINQIYIIIANIPVKALLDTGAMCSLLDYNFSP